MSSTEVLPKSFGPSIEEGRDRYEVKSSLGGGGMGDVFRVNDRVTRRELALKVLKFSYPRALHYFKREFRAVASLAHENLVSLYDLHYENDQYFYTMELVEGSDLYVHVNGHNRVVTDPSVLCSPARLNRVREATIQLLRALAFLHHNDRVHRDIKPSNILVSRDGRVKLVDFGIVKELIPGGEGQSLSQVFGTSTYFSPEQSLGSHVGPEADLYSVGVVLYELLAGSPPFVGESARVALQHRNDPPPSLVTKVPGASPDLVLVCMALLKKKPSQRPSAMEALEMLRSDAGLDATSIEFVGRQSERRTLYTALEDVRSGQGRMVVIEGLSGIGKTFLLKTFGDEARELQSAKLFTGMCVQRDHVPMRGLDTLVERLAEAYRKETARAMRRLEPGERAALINAFTFLGELLPVDEHGTDDGRATAASGLHRLLTSLANKRLLVLILEHLHLADDAVLDVLENLPTGSDLPPIMIICTVRPDLMDETSRIRDFLTTIQSRQSTQIIKLKRFTESETQQYFKVHFGEPTPDVLVPYVQEQTEGNPLFVKEMVEAMRREPSAPPPSLDETIRRRLSSLGDDQRLREVAGRIVQALAANRGPIAVTTLMDAAGLTPVTLYEALRVLSAEDIAELVTLQVDGQIQALVVGSHEPLMDRVRQIIDLREWHPRLAGAHEKNRGPSLAIEEQWRLAGQMERIWTYVQQEKQRAIVDGNPARAAEIIALALKSPEAQEDTALQASLLNDQQFALARCGRYREAAESIERLEMIDSAGANALRGRRCDYYLRSGNLAAFDAHSNDLPKNAYGPFADALVELLPRRAEKLMDTAIGPLKTLVKARLDAARNDGASITDAKISLERLEREIRDETDEWSVRLAVARVEIAQAEGYRHHAINIARDTLKSCSDEISPLLISRLKVTLGRALIDGGHVNATRDIMGKLLRDARKRRLPVAETLSAVLLARAALVANEISLADDYIERASRSWPDIPPSLPHVRIALVHAEKALVQSDLAKARETLNRLENATLFSTFTSHRDVKRQTVLLRLRIDLVTAFSHLNSETNPQISWSAHRESLSQVKPGAEDWTALVDAFDALSGPDSMEAVEILSDAIDLPTESPESVARTLLLGMQAMVKSHYGIGGHREWRQAEETLKSVGAAWPPELRVESERRERDAEDG